MVNRRIDIQGVDVDNITEVEFFQFLESSIYEGPKRVIFFANAHVVNVAQRDPEFHAVLRSGDLVLPDGMGLRIAGRILRTPIKANLNGTDLMPKVLHYAAARGFKVFLLGSRPGVADSSTERLKATIPGLSIVGCHHGYFGADEEPHIISRINEADPDILLVAMGVPLQEKWIDRLANELEARLIFGVGALFDFLSGGIPRAPLFLRMIGMEWVYRLWQEPRRMWRRYTVGNPVFLYRTILRGVRGGDRLAHLSQCGSSEDKGKRHGSTSVERLKRSSRASSF